MKTLPAPLLSAIGLVFLAQAVLADVGGDKCTGKDCQVSSINMPNRVPYGSLPHLSDGGCTAVGRLKYASDAGYMQCQGGPWTSMGGGTSGTAEPLTATLPIVIFDDGGTVNLSISEEVSLSAASFPTTAAPETTNFTGGGAFPSAATTLNVTCSWHTALTGDNSKHVEVQLWDVASAAELCTCRLGNCDPADTSSTGGSVDVPRTCTCTGGALAGARPATVRFKNTTDCTADPGQVLCTGVFSIP